MESQDIFDIYRRLNELEFENEQLKEQAIKNKREIKMMQIEGTTSLPDTKLYSNSFMVRAFSAWWHVFVAQLVISLVFYFAFVIGWGRFFTLLLQSITQTQ